MSTSKTETKVIKSMAQLRVEAKEKGVEQIEKWDDPRLVTLLSTIHTHAEASSYCSTFDTIIAELGIPARPKNDYFQIERSGIVKFGGEDYPVTAKIQVYGEVGDEDGAIANYEKRYGEKFEDVLARQLRKGALEAIASTVEIVPA